MSLFTLNWVGLFIVSKKYDRILDPAKRIIIPLLASFPPLSELNTCDPSMGVTNFLTCSRPVP